MGYVLLLVGLLVLYAFIESGIVASLIIVGVTSVVLGLAYFISKKTEKKGISRTTDVLVKIFAYVLIAISVVFFLIGIISFFVGFLSGESYDSFNGNVCGICGGDGRFLGDKCSGCRGWGYEIESNTIWSVSTWPGLLIALASVVTFIGTVMMFEDSLTLFRKNKKSK